MAANSILRSPNNGKIDFCKKNITKSYINLIHTRGNEISAPEKHQRNRADAVDMKIWGEGEKKRDGPN